MQHRQLRGHARRSPDGAGYLLQQQVDRLQRLILINLVGLDQVLSAIENGEKTMNWLLDAGGAVQVGIPAGSVEVVKRSPAQSLADTHPYRYSSFTYQAKRSPNYLINYQDATVECCTQRNGGIY